MLIKKPADIPSSEITPKSVYMDRRKFMAGAAATGAAALITGCVREVLSPSQKVEASGTKLQTSKSPLSANSVRLIVTDCCIPRLLAPRHNRGTPEHPGGS